MTISWVPAVKLHSIRFLFKADFLDTRQVSLHFWLPATEYFTGRFMGTGGAGSSTAMLGRAFPPGLALGMAVGESDGALALPPQGWSSWALRAPGHVDLDKLDSLASRAQAQLGSIGAALTENYYQMPPSAGQGRIAPLRERPEGSLKRYFYGCSTGGRQGHAMAQKYPDLYDGILGMAPAIAWSNYVLGQLWPPMLMHNASYFPSHCEMNAILRDMIVHCDGLDGREDGVLERPELCRATYNATQAVGDQYTCVINGKPSNNRITKQAANLVNALLKGPHNEQGRRLWFGIMAGARMGSEGENPNAPTGIALAATEYNPKRQKFEAAPLSGAVEWLSYFLRKRLDAKPDLGQISIDEYLSLLTQSRLEYDSFLQNTHPDLSAFKARGGKLINWHGEADPILPPENSALYYEKVRRTMFGRSSSKKGLSSLLPTSKKPTAEEYKGIQSFYRLYFTPGMGHCAVGPDMPNQGVPTNSLRQLVEWVEQGIEPDRLHSRRAAELSDEGEICMWPTRPRRTEGGTKLVCEMIDSIESYIPPLDGLVFEP